MINYTVQCDRCKVESEKQSTRDGWVRTPQDWKDITLEASSRKLRVHLCSACSIALFGAVTYVSDAPEEKIINLIREIVVEEVNNSRG